MKSKERRVGVGFTISSTARQILMDKAIADDLSYSRAVDTIILQWHDIRHSKSFYEYAEIVGKEKQWCPKEAHSRANDLSLPKPQKLSF